MRGVEMPDDTVHAECTGYFISFTYLKRMGIFKTVVGLATKSVRDEICFTHVYL